MANYASAYIPPPTPRQAPDIKDDPNRWSWYRIRFNLPVEKGSKPWTKIGDVPESDDDPDWRGVVRSKVDKWPLPEEYKFGTPVYPRYFYFDTPDYADPFKKLGYASKWFAVTGLAAAALAGTIRGYETTWPLCFQLIKEVGLPWFGAGMAAATTTIVCADLRKQDGYFNYVVGGFVFGYLQGVGKGAPQCFRRVALAIPAAVYIKYNAEKNGSLFPNINARSMNLPISGMSAQNGWRDGDFRFGYRSMHEEPGRDVRIPYA